MTPQPAVFRASLQRLALLLAAVVFAMVAPPTLLAQDPPEDVPATPADGQDAPGDADTPEGDADDPADGDGEEGGEDDATSAAERLITQAGVAAIEKAQAYLAEMQRPNGSFSSGSSRAVVAASALAGLALLGGGHHPNRGPYGDNVQSLIDWLIENQSPQGYFNAPDDGSRIHGHGYAGLFLAQVYGMCQDEELNRRFRRSLRSAVQLTERSQTDEGGWGYVPDENTWDEGSTTVTQIQFLRAARDAGIRVDRRVIDRAIDYVHRCAMRVDWVDGSGQSHVGYTFKYSLRYNSSRSTFPLTAAAVSVLQGSGRYEGEVVEGGIDWLHAFFQENMAGRPSLDWYQNWFYYSHFYAAQAFFHAEDLAIWDSYYPRLRDTLLALDDYNARTGAWTHRMYGEAYATGLATLMLQIPYNYLPIFQR